MYEEKREKLAYQQLSGCSSSELFHNTSQLQTTIIPNKQFNRADDSLLLLPLSKARQEWNPKNQDTITRQ